MPSPRELHVCAFFLLMQVFSLASAQQTSFPTGPRYIESEYGDSGQLKEQLPSPDPGNHKHEPQLHTAQTGSNFTEEDLIVLIGTDLQVPYPLYEQISNSFLLSKDILVLLPNNTIVTVTGYADLKDITKEDPEDTKVLISSDSMIPAPIYLRIVLIQPEEVTVQLPDGEILPNKICQELFDEKVSTTVRGGQTYYTKVDDKDSFPFLVVNEPGHEDTDESVASPPRISDKYLEPRLDRSGIMEFTPFYDPALVYERSRPQPVPYFFNSPVQEPERGPRSFYLELASRYQNRFLVPHSDPRRNYGKRMVFLPPGIHIMDSARCGICDPTSPEARIRIISV